MSGSPKYDLEFGEGFEGSLKKLTKSCYGKSTADRVKFNELFARIVKALLVDPRAYGGEWEPWPRGQKQHPWEFWKVDFRLPGHRGGREQGRLMYLTNADTRVLRLVWVYTHDQYESRPSEKEIRERLRRNMNG